MNVDRPHEIVRLPNRARDILESMPTRKWLPLTEDEARMLEPLNAAQRAEWLASLPFVERLRRFTAAENAEGRKP